MGKREKAGAIDCPTCGTVGAMEVRTDKNGEPFGHCIECDQQLRIGGKARRVQAFKRRNPWWGQYLEQLQEQKGKAPAPAPAQATATATATAPAPAPRKAASVFDFLGA